MCFAGHVCCELLGPGRKKVQDRPHRSHLVTNEHLLSVHMCTALNWAITERTGGGKGRGKQGIRFIRKVVPAGAASRVSLQRGITSRDGS